MLPAGNNPRLNVGVLPKERGDQPEVRGNFPREEANFGRRHGAALQITQLVKGNAFHPRPFQQKTKPKSRRLQSSSIRPTVHGPCLRTTKWDNIVVSKFRAAPAGRFARHCQLPMHMTTTHYRARELQLLGDVVTARLCFSCSTKVIMREVAALDFDNLKSQVSEPKCLGLSCKNCTLSKQPATLLGYFDSLSLSIYFPQIAVGKSRQNNVCECLSHPVVLGEASLLSTNSIAVA
ncbi:hypothetical protein BCR37DRAFT_299031 [Protomyces lactucae-debilis]|uniref:Uncharacterized protein n=1 Tax=Protomyces lactucae-debilis TaxID=2754530 RepID=A0A1Y2FIL5_PROLT|nr:uncharacterized protein BCR37DRAFT_299031 [Protomyces lactucae-debilis]ORY83224.1 hypothetical protein BCR37DRAFT_299031 [Protomyces lactucae-debilis]